MNGLTINPVSMYDYNSIVNSVINACFNYDEDGRQFYMPENYAYALRLNLATYYLKYKIDDDIEVNYQKLFEIGKVWDAVYAHPQVQDIIKAVDQGIEFRKQSILRREIFSPLVDELMPVCEQISSAVEQINTTGLKMPNADELVKAYKEQMLTEEK